MGLETDKKALLGKLTLSEVYEIPERLHDVLRSKNRAKVTEVVKELVAKEPHHIYITGNGTSHHAGLAGMYLFNQLAKVKTICEYSPEFEYSVYPSLRNERNDVVIAVSQSGESRNTKRAVQMVEQTIPEVTTITITNNPESTLAKSADLTLLTYSGEEKGVLATKTYICQLAVLYELAIELAYQLNVITGDVYKDLMESMENVPSQIDILLPIISKRVKTLAPYFKFAQKCHVLGSGPDYATALEIALKMKEGARINAEAYSMSEFLHGPITLADEHSWILMIIPPEKGARRDEAMRVLEKIHERNGTILGIISSDDSVPQVDMSIEVPSTKYFLHPFFNIIPMQLLSVEIAALKGINCDHPVALNKIAEI